MPIPEELEYSAELAVGGGMMMVRSGTIGKAVVFSWKKSGSPLRQSDGNCQALIMDDASWEAYDYRGVISVSG
jgi:hypothetical protein